MATFYNVFPEWNEEDDEFYSGELPSLVVMGLDPHPEDRRGIEAILIEKLTDIHGVAPERVEFEEKLGGRR